MALTPNEKRELAALVVDQHLDPDNLEYLTVVEAATEIAEEGFVIWADEPEFPEDYVQVKPKLDDDDIKAVHEEAVKMLKWLSDRLEMYND